MVRLLAPLMEEDEENSPTTRWVTTEANDQMPPVPAPKSSSPSEDNRWISQSFSNDSQFLEPSSIDDHDAISHREYTCNNKEIEAKPVTLSMMVQVPSSPGDDLSILMRECNVRVLKHRLRSLKRRLFLEQVDAMAVQEQQALHPDVQKSQCWMTTSSKDTEFCISVTSRSQPETINRMTTHAA